MEFWILAFPNIGILFFWFTQHWKFQVLLFQTLELCILAFPHIRILNFAFFKLEFWILTSQTLEFRVLAFPNIGILNCGFSKDWNSVFWLFQILELWILVFPNIWILDIHCRDWNGSLRADNSREENNSVV